MAFEGHQRRWDQVFLAAVNRVLAAVLLVVLLPVLIGVGLLVRCTSPGPMLFRQRRVGQYGRLFTIYKFRTMRVGAEQELMAVLAAQGVSEVEPFVKIVHDPRVTRVGRVLRALSLDELPQLFNVMRGDMRFVGPRPQSLAEVAAYDANAWRRLLVPPGITGLWQVSGRSDLSSERGVELDVEYVQRWSWALELRVLLLTPLAVLKRRGAY